MYCMFVGHSFQQQKQTLTTNKTVTLYMCSHIDAVFFRLFNTAPCYVILATLHSRNNNIVTHGSAVKVYYSVEFLFKAMTFAK